MCHETESSDIHEIPTCIASSQLGNIECVILFQHVDGLSAPR